MKSSLEKNHRLLFYSCWLILGLIQSRFTELLDDEAYYWVYSKFLDWGYFDHPPMVALLIKTGYAMFHNELGVRLLFVFLNTGTLLIIEKLTERKSARLFYTIALSLAILQLGGFLAVPDTPLIFFTALFFLCYREFIQRPTLLNTFWLGIVTAALFYSKYHAVLITVLVLLSNPKLFARYQTYLAGVIALALFAPHLWWQYNHDWISFRYHLFESNVNPYQVSFTLAFIGGQILVAGPFAGVILLPAAFLCRLKNDSEADAKEYTPAILDRRYLLLRAMKFTLVGIYIFFLISSFRGKVEANWTSPAIVPLFILSESFLSSSRTGFAAGARKWLARLLPVTMVIVLLLRIVMLVDIIPSNAIKERYHSWKSWPAVMREKTRSLPVVFENSYQRASKYWFYSGQMTYSLNWYRERRNNYDFWPIEDSLLGRPVFLLDIHNLDSFQNRMATAIGTIGYRYDSAFSSFAKLQFVPSEKTIHGSRESSFEIHVRPNLPEKYVQYSDAHPDLNCKIFVGVFGKHGWIKDLPVPLTLQQSIRGPSTLTFASDLPKGNYYLIFSVYSPGTIIPSHNSAKIKLVIP